jgi:hypothetical protein
MREEQKAIKKMVKEKLKQVKKAEKERRKSFVREVRAW